MRTTKHQPLPEPPELEPSPQRPLRDLELELQALRAASPDIVTVIDAEGFILRMDLDDDQHGLRSEAVVGRHIGELLPPAVRRAAMVLWQRALATGRVQELSFTLEIDGLPRHFAARARAFGDPPRLLVNTRDVTRERRMQERLLAIQRFEGVAMLASALAHDFSNLLTGIIGNAELARLEFPTDGVADEALGDVISAARRAAELCHQLCGMSGKRRTSIDFVNLSDLASQMLVILRTSIGPRIKVVRELAPPETMPVLIADDAQLRQIVLNLLASAADSLGDDGGVVTIRTGVLRDPQSDGQWVFLEVEDTGRGLDATTRQRLLDPSSALPIEPRALGLAATLGIVRGHGGTMDVDAAPTGGMRVRVMLPQEADALGASTALATGAEKSLAVSSPEPSLPLPRLDAGGLVLLVSSDPTLVAACRDALERAGHRVQPIASAAEALIALRSIALLVRGVVVDADTSGPGGAGLGEQIGAISGAIPRLVVGGAPPKSASRSLLHAPRDLSSEGFGRGLARLIAQLQS